MNTDILISNITNPTLLFFLLGIIASLVKSDLEIPQPSVKFISLYLLFSIGFKGGQELAHSGINQEIIYSLLYALVISAVIPFYLFYLALPKFGPSNAGAVAAAYGSVSAVTFVSAANFLEASQIEYGGHMVAVMAFMEAPAIIVGVSLMKRYQKNCSNPRISGLSGFSLTHQRISLNDCRQSLLSALLPTPNKLKALNLLPMTFLKDSWPSSF